MSEMKRNAVKERPAPALIEGPTRDWQSVGSLKQKAVRKTMLHTGKLRVYMSGKCGWRSKSATARREEKDRKWWEKQARRWGK